MRTLIISVMLMLAAAACRKTAYTPPAPQVSFTDLNGIGSGAQQPVTLDLDNDGVKDIRFTFTLVGDPIMQVDKHQFYVSGYLHTYFPVNSAEACPVLPFNGLVSAESFPGYTWYNAPAMMLAEKVVSMNQPPYWQGLWYSTAHRYIPFYLLKDGKRYFGWIEFSFDTTTEKVLLYSAGVAKEAEKSIRAGQH
ncbi:MAG TPA: hypothetical protein VF145_02705 [Chitinophagaceae bacterium]